MSIFSELLEMGIRFMRLAACEDAQARQNLCWRGNCRCSRLCVYAFPSGHPDLSTDTLRNLYPNYSGRQMYLSLVARNLQRSLPLTPFPGPPLKR